MSYLFVQIRIKLKINKQTRDNYNCDYNIRLLLEDKNIDGARNHFLKVLMLLILVFTVVYGMTSKQTWWIFLLLFGWTLFSLFNNVLQKWACACDEHILLRFRSRFSSIYDHQTDSWSIPWKFLQLSWYDLDRYVVFLVSVWH